MLSLIEWLFQHDVVVDLSLRLILMILADADYEPLRQIEWDFAQFDRNSLTMFAVKEWGKGWWGLGAASLSLRSDYAVVVGSEIDIDAGDYFDGFGPTCADLNSSRLCSESVSAPTNNPSWLNQYEYCAISFLLPYENSISILPRYNGLFVGVVALADLILLSLVNFDLFVVAIN